RVRSITSPGGAFAYDYGATGSGALVKRLGLPSGAITNSFDALGQLTNTTLLSPWNSPLNAFGYSYNKWSQRTNISRLFNGARSSLSILYDDAGQLTGAVGRETNGSTRLQENFAYTYDAALNLATRANNALVESFNSDAANQLSTITRSGTLTVAGL